MNLPINQVIEGNCLDVMQEWPDECIDFIQFSPPYWGLRNYGESTETVWGGNHCEHEWVEERMTLVHENRNFQKGTQEEVHGNKPTTYIKKYDDKKAGFCVKCGAWKGQLGLEPTWQMYVEHMAEICRELKRVLKKTGSMYIVLGDTYAGSHCGKGDKTLFQNYRRLKVADNLYGKPSPQAKATDYQPKCLMGVPWRVAFALIDDGWILRNDIIWRKPNAMPSSVKDRLATTYEHIFHFVKQRKYFYDLDAIRKPHTSVKDLGRKRLDTKTPKHDLALKIGAGSIGPSGYLVQHPLGKNPGDVFRSNSKFLKSDVKTASPGGRGIRAIKEGKLTTFVRKRILDVGAYLKQKLKESGYKTEELAEIIKIKKTTIDHYFRTDFTGQALPDRHTWKLLKPLLNLGEYEDFIDEEIRSALPQPHPLGKNPGDVVSTKHDLAVNRVGNFSYTDPLHVKAYNTKGKNPGDVIKYNSKYEKSDYGQTLQAFTREQTILKARKQSRIDAKRLFPNDLQKQQEYINYIHDHDGHPKGKNPGDIIKTKNAQEAFLGHPPTNYYRMGESEKGKNPGDYWSVNTKPFKGAHFAVYPEAICVKPILSSCPPDGVVLDPMAGSGTTCVVAKKLGKKYIGIELNSEYVTIAKKRLSKISEKLSFFFYC